MADVLICGIKNCDTMQKAMKWLDAQGVAYQFHDYKKEGIAEAALQTALEQHEWDVVINKRGTTWRKLPDDVKASMDAAGAKEIAHENPSLVKRPLLIHQGQAYLGFKEDFYANIFA